jgi:hypothetical protein
MDLPGIWAGDSWSTWRDGDAEDYFLPIDGEGINGSRAMVAHWDASSSLSAGSFTVGLGQLPDAYDDESCGGVYPCEYWAPETIVTPSEKYTEIWTRQYVKLADGWNAGCIDDFDEDAVPQTTGIPDGNCDFNQAFNVSPAKFHRLRVLSDYKLAAELEAVCAETAGSPYACCTGNGDDGNCLDDFAPPRNRRHPTAYQGHFWQQHNTNNDGTLGAMYFNSTRGVDANGVVVDTGNNCGESGADPICTHDWYDQVRGSDVIFTDSAPTSAGWFCIETHVQLNEPGETNGVEEFYVSAGIGNEGILDESNSSQNMLYSYSDYGINQVIFDNYWNEMSPADNDLYRDNFVIGTERIGCAISYATEPTGVLAWHPFDWRLFR